MRRYPLVPQRWAMCTRRPDMLCEQILDGVRAEATAVDVGEQRRCSSAWRFLQPVLHRSADLACERRAPFLAALSDPPGLRAGAQPERKGVLWGKRGSVRLDFGGHRYN